MEFSVEELKDLIDAITESVETTEKRVDYLETKRGRSILAVNYYVKLHERNLKYLERLDLIERRLEVELGRLVKNDLPKL